MLVMLATTVNAGGRVNSREKPIHIRSRSGVGQLPKVAMVVLAAIRKTIVTLMIVVLTQSEKMPPVVFFSLIFIYYVYEYYSLEYQSY